VGPFLLDINVLIALSWPDHSLRTRAERWFAARGHLAWATCPLTQAGFVRILSNPAFSPHALTPRDALSLLESNLKHPNHQFWAASIPLGGAVAKVNAKLQGHRQITDAYLVGLAAQRKGKLATMDGGVMSLVGESYKSAVEYIR
jgi:toxin-antitoxin system PIN domain toxin